MDNRGIELRWKAKEKIISPQNDHIEFACQRGKNVIGNNPLRQKCNDGVMTLPECV